jgi:hypothetical protein
METKTNNTTLSEQLLRVIEKWLIEEAKMGRKWLDQTTLSCTQISSLSEMMLSYVFHSKLVVVF